MLRTSRWVMSLTVVLAGTLTWFSDPTPAQSPPAREVAVTIDDLPAAGPAGRGLAGAARITRELVGALSRLRVPAIGFVNEDKLEDNGLVNPDRVALLRAWLEAGLELGNHTRTHLDLHAASPDRFSREILEGERVTRPLAREAGRKLKYFRHPFLHTGRSARDRQAVDAFLSSRGYRVAPVTIDNHDYLFAAAYDRAGALGDAALQARVATEYLAYMERVFAYYEAQSIALAGREIRQTLLLHANALNAATFDTLARTLTRRGYTFVSLDRALEDPAYTRRDEYYGPAGMTWLHRWALTEGRRGTFFAGEPEVPGWIERAGR
jgi:peptidoglycan/xylan/chitin deacetylase (PgdA/CDA1 family)